MLGVGIIGLGAIAKYYLDAIHRSPSFSLVAACDRDPQRSALVPPGAAFTSDSRELLGWSSVDAVVIAAPNDVHADLCAAALAHGKHACCEKPLTLSSADADALRHQEGVADRTLLTAFHRRYNHNVLAMMARLGGAPAIRHVEVRYEERIEEHCGEDAWYLDPKRCGGGCIADNGPNALDLVNLLVGEAAVVTSSVTFDEAGVDRQATISLRSSAGATASVLLDWSYPGERKAIAVTTADGAIYTADMLDGFLAFKSSLHHEYDGILADWADHISTGRSGVAGGALVAAQVSSAYRLARTEPARRQVFGS